MNRTAYGYPAELRLIRAKQIAAQAKERNQPACDCKVCHEIEYLPKVQKIVESFNKSGEKHV